MVDWPIAFRPVAKQSTLVGSMWWSSATHLTVTGKQQGREGEERDLGTRYTFKGMPWVT